MADRYAEDIRRIVDIDVTENALDDAAPKDTIEGKRGIGFLTTDSRSIAGTPTGSAAGSIGGGTVLNTGNTFSPSSGIPGAAQTNTGGGSRDSDADNNATGGGGSIINPQRPSDSNYSDTLGRYKADDIIDQTNKFPTVSTDPQSGVGALDQRVGGTLISLDDIVDCDTLKPIELRLDGLFIPPPDWFDPDTPPAQPLVDVYETGIRWGNLGGLPGFFGVLASDAIAIRDADQAENDFFRTATVFEPEFVPGFDRFRLSYNKSPPTIELTFFARQFTCVVDVEEFCVSSDPNNYQAQDWPADGKMQLILEDGKFVPHIREPDADLVTEYSDNQHSQIDFCFGPSNSRTGSLVQTREGGLALFETSGGVPTGIITIFSATHKVTAYTDFGGLNAYLVP